MKKAAQGILVALIALTLASPALAIGPIGKRQIHQQKRIHQGVKSGSLTPKEAYRLEKEQVRIQRKKRQFLSDGEFTCKERAKTHRMLNRSSRHIYRLKHNGKTR